MFLVRSIFPPEINNLSQRKELIYIIKTTYIYIYIYIYN